jgi:carboxyl-terminal processing protease
MKNLIALTIMLPVAVAAQDHEKACDVFSKVNYVLQEAHIKPKPIDDSLSVYVFNSIIEDLDDNSTLFLQEDYNQLAQHKFLIDDYLKAGECAFLNDFITLYRKALERKKAYIEEISGENLVYNSSDTIFYSRSAFPYHKEAGKIKNFIRKKITYDVLEDISKMSKNKDSLRVHLAKLGAVSKGKVTESYLCRVNTLLNPSDGFENSFYNLFFSTFCSYFDPHSTYFSYNDKASFMSSIATENYSLGLYVSQNDKEEIVVEEIVPGGPAFKTQKITKGDQLLKLAANDQEYAVTCASMETISRIVLSDTYRNVELTLRKNDGTVYSVKLEKKIMKAEDHSVYSYVLGETDPVGYVKVPSFYTALDDNSTNGCADDVAREVEKLKQQGIMALIIDLQYNGGGSMDEVIRMAGLFIDSGPMAVITGKGKSYDIIKDYQRGTVYNGPMVVLVNGFSASASEFFAGVMQDYNRALIAGSNTLGKATMQTILPLEGSQQDFVKVTIDRFYRVTGKSSQYTGVTPDVKMPSFFEKLLPRESSMPNAIKNDSVAVKVKFRQLPDDLIKQAAELSKKRIESDTDFRLIDSINKRIEALYGRDKAALPVTFDNVFADVHSMDGIWKDINTASEKEYTFKVANTTTAAMANDDFFTSINEQKIKSVKTDACIAEALRIATDLYNLKYNKLAVTSN